MSDEVGHNAKEQLKSIVERIERLDEEKWIPGRPVQDGDNVIFQTLRLLRQAGYAIVPAEKQDKGE